MRIGNIDQTQTFCLMYMFMKSSKGSDHLLVGFDLDWVNLQEEPTNWKSREGENNIRLTLRYVCGFAEGHEKATCGLG